MTDLRTYQRLLGYSDSTRTRVPYLHNAPRIYLAKARRKVKATVCICLMCLCTRRLQGYNVTFTAF